MLSNSTNNITSPRITSPPSTSDQWAAILRYDTSRRDSAGTSHANTSDSTLQTKTRRNSDHESTLLKQQMKRLSLGDNLPHMPLDPHLSSNVQPQISLGSSILHAPIEDEKGCPPTERPATPPALKGDNAILVNREVERLRNRHSKATQRHWRIYTGTAMLIVLGLCAFIFAKYILAYLSLSPANWLLSDSADGATNTSPDPLLRIMTLIGMCASGISLLGVLSSGFYLRFSRQTSWWTLFVWLAAIISTTISILLGIVNLSLISIWHSKSSSSASAFAATRDVSLRCSGSWSLDVLWQAAQNSSQAKVDKDNLPTCQHDAKGTLQAYLIAGAIRLIVFIVFCSLWLIFLNKYNHTLLLIDDSFEEVEESAEMHRLLMEVDDRKHSSKLQAGSGFYTEKDPGINENTFEEHSNMTSLLPPPRLDRFRWQKDSSTVEESFVREQHEKEASAGAWSIGVVGQVWDALWGTSDSVDRRQVRHQVGKDCTEDDLVSPLHDRQDTRLGVRGWFRTSEQVSDDYGKIDTLNDDPVRRPVHVRTPSQEKRASEGRHTSARLAKVREEESIHEAKRRNEMRRVDQEHRLEFLASLAEVRDGERSHSFRRCSQSAGDDLPHMPELNTIVNSNEYSIAGDDGICWQPLLKVEASSNQEMIPPTHLYVRTLGKLIRTMSAIESEGSQERADRAARTGLSGSECQLY